jgi:hypothetical protein
MANQWGINGARFRVTVSPGFTASYVSESIAVPVHFGTLLEGVAVVYDACSFGTMLLATMTFQGFGTSLPCAYLDVGPDPGFGWPEPVAQNCYFDLLSAPSAQKLYVNASPDQCQPNCSTVPTRSATWGKVKALYRN